MEYGILSLLPTVLTVVLAFLTRQVALSLLVGTFAGALIMSGFNPVLGFTETLNTYVVGALADTSHASILIFTLVVAGMVSLLSAMGGTQAIAQKLSKHIKTSRGAQLITTLVGCLVFFDDYANILIVGPTMRPLTDKLRVSREKLAYIVHTTAGVVSGVAVMTTWIGFEIGLVTDAFTGLGYDVNGFWMVLQNIPYMFYNFMAIAISFMAAFFMRDFGPMYKAERRTRLTGKLYAPDASIAKAEKEADGEEPPAGKISYAVIPILTMVAVIFGGIWYMGAPYVSEGVSWFSFEGLRQSFGEADPMPPIVWAAVASSLVAGIIAKAKLKFSLKKIYDVWVKGFLSLCEVGIIIILAWAVGGVVKDMGTADYLISIVSGNMSAALIPAIIFAVSCLVSFSTGTSWGTMPIIFPIAIPLAAAFVDDPTQSHIVIATIAAVLSGSIFGDQTSPISDSSILSAATSGCDLLHHVKTQIPYALVPAAIAFVGYLLVGFGNVSALVVLAAGLVVLFAVMRLVGKSTEEKDLRATALSEEERQLMAAPMAEEPAAAEVAGAGEQA